MTKSPDAFRTISEVAEWLDVPAHVLRFWESRFAQVKPLKRAGGRRYYRPTDMELLGGIKRLLHDDGLTIRGVQKLLREEGIRHVAALSPAITADEDDIEMSDETGSEDAGLNAAGPLFGGGDGPARTDAEDASTPDAFGVSPDLYAPAPSILARLVGLDRRRFAEAGVDPAPLLERAQALAAVMDRHG